MPPLNPNRNFDSDPPPTHPCRNSPPPRPLQACLNHLENDRRKGLPSGKENGNDGSMSDTGSQERGGRGLKQSQAHRRNRKHLLELQKISAEKRKLDEDQQRLEILRAQKRKAQWSKIQSKVFTDGDNGDTEGSGESEQNRNHRVKEAQKECQTVDGEEKDKPTPEEIQARREAKEKARELAERNAKHLQGLADKRNAQKNIASAKEEKSKAMAKIAREQVLMLLERNRNGPGNGPLPGQDDDKTTISSVERGLQDSEENHDEAGGDDSPLDPKYAAMRRKQEEMFLKSQASVDKYIAKKRDKEETAKLRVKPSEMEAQMEREKWLRMRGLRDTNPDCKIFSIEPVKQYPDIRREFLRRGWVENTDTDVYPTVFDFKWTLRKADVPFNSLLDAQVAMV